MRFLPRKAKRSNVSHSVHSRDGSFDEHTLTNQCLLPEGNILESFRSGRSSPKSARVGMGYLVLLLQRGACQEQRQHAIILTPDPDTTLSSEGP